MLAGVEDVLVASLIDGFYAVVQKRRARKLPVHPFALLDTIKALAKLAQTCRTVRAAVQAFFGAFQRGVGMDEDGFAPACVSAPHRFAGAIPVASLFDFRVASSVVCACCARVFGRQDYDVSTTLRRCMIRLSLDERKRGEMLPVCFRCYFKQDARALHVQRLAEDSGAKERHMAGLHSENTFAARFSKCASSYFVDLS